MPIFPRINSAFQQFRLIHWLMAIAYFGLVIFGLSMSKLFPKGTIHDVLYFLHSSVGVLMILLLGVRMAYLLRIMAKRYQRVSPPITPKWILTFSIHTLLYALMLGIPLTGIWLVNSAGTGNLSLFGIPLPDFFPISRSNMVTAYEFHEKFADLIIFLSFVHLVEKRKHAVSLWRRVTQKS